METATLALESVAEQVVLDRRHLHMHPELRFQEFKTAAFVAERLRLLGLQVQTGIGGTGVVALLRGGRPGKTVMLRADMDALPILEETDVPFKSTVPGVMHACGHDGHTAILLGVARVLVERRHRLAGNVKFVFQPAEEGGRGALGMIEGGVLENPTVDAVFGLHLVQFEPVGRVSARPGPIHASTMRIEIDIRGKGGHAAFPHLAIDTVLIAAQVTVALHAIVSREVKPTETAVITIGSSHAGTAANVIPETAELRGTIRAYDEKLVAFLGQRVKEVATGVASAMRGVADARVNPGLPPVVNDPAMAELANAVALEVVGPERAVPSAPNMAGDDMAEYLRRVPGCYFWVGTRNEAKGIIGDHHQPTFDIDEDALPIGIDVLSGIAERYLNS